MKSSTIFKAATFYATGKGLIDIQGVTVVFVFSHLTHFSSFPLSLSYLNFPHFSRIPLQSLLFQRYRHPR